VTWPDGAYARADSPFGSVAGHPIEVRRIAPGDAVPPSQVVFVAGADLARAREVMRGAPRYALLVTEAADALEHGSVINFVIEQARVRFDISLESAEKRGIRLSSRLLAVARAVRGSQ
jgi:hypothetical protein